MAVIVKSCQSSPLAAGRRVRGVASLPLTKGRPEEPAYPIGDVIAWTYSGRKLHPTQKPLPVLLPPIETFSALRGLVISSHA